MDIEIVAIAGDTKCEDMRAPVPEEVYLPYSRQDFSLGINVYLHTRGSRGHVHNCKAGGAAGRSNHSDVRYADAYQAGG
jgi:hypothetical protein